MLNDKHNSEQTVITASLIFVVLAFFVPSVKVFFALSFLYFAWLSITYSFAKAIIYGSLVIGFFAVGQNHQLLVIHKAAIVSSQYLEGRHISWSITPGLMIALVGSGAFYWWNRQSKKKLQLVTHEKMIIIMAGWGLLASSYGALVPSLSMFFVVSGLVSVVWLAYLLVLGQNYDKQDWMKIIQTLFQLIIVLTLYENFIVFLQTLHRGPIGLLIETTAIAPVFGLGADEGSGGFRPFGLNSHPNGLANKQLILLASLLTLRSYLGKQIQENKQKKIWNTLFQLTVSSSLITIVLSLSRAAFISIGLALLLIIYRHPSWIEKARAWLQKETRKIQFRHKLLIILLGAVLTFKFSERMLNSIYSFSGEGGVSTRLIQYQEAWAVFLQSPVFGIGDQMFIPTSFQLFPKGVMTYFPENVHNGFLLLLVERGSIGLLLTLGFIYFLIKAVQKSKLTRTTQTMIYSGLVASLSVMLFHPERNFLSLLIVITIGLIHYEKWHQKKATS